MKKSRTRTVYIAVNVINTEPSNVYTSLSRLCKEFEPKISYWAANRRLKYDNYGCVGSCFIFKLEIEIPTNSHGDIYETNCIVSCQETMQPTVIVGSTEKAKANQFEREILIRAK